MAKDDQAVEQILLAMRKQQDALGNLQETLITRAKLQEYTETQFNALIHIARGGIELVSGVREGDMVTEEWIKQRDRLVGMAQRLIQDAD